MASSTAISTSSRHAALSNPLLRRLLVGFSATLAVAVSAHVAFPLPFTPVPLTLQPLAVLLVGLFLGPVDGALAMVAYLLEGAAGLPVFSPTGPGGVLQILGPTGGFLMAYPVVALISGFVSRRLSGVAGASVAALIACTLATSVLFLSGASWMAHLHPVSARSLWILAIAPFLPGEAVKVFIAAGVYRALSPTAAR